MCGLFRLTTLRPSSKVNRRRSWRCGKKLHLQKDQTRFIGVDLGGGKGKKTALAILERTKTGVTVTALRPRSGEAPLYDKALCDLIRAHAQGSVLCVDAPLTLPPCIRCPLPVCPGQTACADPEVALMHQLFDAPTIEPDRDFRRGKPGITPYTQRATDIYLFRRRAILPRETLGQGMGPITARAVHLARTVADLFALNRNLIEVYPRATLQLLGFQSPYRKRVDQRIDILASLRDLSFGPGIWREECRQSDHAFDAIVCAYTGYLRCRDGWEMLRGLPSPQIGWVWVPPEVAEKQKEAAAD